MQSDAIRTKATAELNEHKRSKVLSAVNAVIKRGLDILLAILGLIILSPVYLGIAIAIKRESPGPVIFKGLRMGRWEKPFYIYKFKTMCDPPVDGQNGPSVTASDDPRITSLGHYLRTSKLNELPQLWNVLKGDMSFVGPRPEDYEIALTWPAEARREILSVRPGITSPASVIYHNEEEMLQGDGFMDDYLGKILPDKLRLDHLYIQNHSLITDVDVLAATFLTLLPLIGGKKVDERWIFGGPTLNFFRRVVPWFLLDVIVATISVGLSGIVWRLSAVINLGIPVFIFLSLAIAILISIINMLIGLQKVSWREASPAYVVDIGISVGLTMVILWMINRFWITEPRIPFSLFWLISITTFVGLVGVRYRERLITSLAYRWLLFRGSSSSFAERVLIVGAGRLGELVSWLIQRSTYSPLFGVIGFADDDPKKRTARIDGIKVLGSTRDIPELTEKYSIAIIIIAISNADSKNIERINEICVSTDAKVIIMPDLVKNVEDTINGIREC